MNLVGKVAIVTGGSRAIGRAYAEALADAGAAVLISDLLEADGAKTVAAIHEKGQKAAFRTVDVSNLKQTEAMAKAAADEFGGVDILINNAAIFASLHGSPMTYISVERWDKTMAVNVRGSWLCIRAVVPYILERRRRAVVNISSISAFGMPGMLDYTASKAAIIGLTKSAASELGGIRVNAIAPGGTAIEDYAEIMGGHLSDAEQRAKATQLIAEQIKPEDMTGTPRTWSARERSSSRGRRMLTASEVSR